jgi:hypothetical protein
MTKEMVKWEEESDGERLGMAKQTSESRTAKYFSGMQLQPHHYLTITS